jgi:hypothetical protein
MTTGQSTRSTAEMNRSDWGCATLIVGIFWLIGGGLIAWGIAVKHSQNITCGGETMSSTDACTSYGSGGSSSMDYQQAIALHQDHGNELIIAGIVIAVLALSVFALAGYLTKTRTAKAAI